MDASPERRKPLPLHKRQLLVYPGFQLRFIAYSLILAIAANAVYFAAAQAFFNKSLAEAGRFGLPPNSATILFIQEQKYMFLMLSIAVCGTTTLILVIGGLIMSNRVAGPLVRFREHLEELSEKPGNASTVERQMIHFRNKDYFQELADAFNKFIRSRRDGG